MSTHHTHTAPNGGWGWVVCVCSLFILGHTNGLMLAMSVMFVSWLEEFGESWGYTSWILSIVFATMYGLGPVAAGVANWIGFRVTIFIGGCLTGTGLVLAYLATSVLYLVITIGVISGVGCCFCYVSCIAVISAYFTTRLTIAVGIACTGVGIGGLVAAHFLNYLTETYEWRGAVLIIGGISFHICVYGLLFRPLVTTLNPGTVKYATGVEIESVADDDDNDDEDRVAMIQKEDDSIEPVGTRGKASGNVNIVENGHTTRLSNPLTYSDGRNRRILPEGDDNYYSIQKSSYVGSVGANLNQPLENNNVNRLFPFHSNRELGKMPCNDDNITVGKRIDKVYFYSDTLFANSSVKHLDTIVLSGSVINILTNRHKECTQSISDIPVCQENDSICVESSDTTMETSNIQRSWLIIHFHTLVQIFKRNKELLEDDVFILYSISNFLASLAYSTPVMFMVDRAVDSGLSKTTGALLISVNGIGNIFGRVIFGAVTYRLFTDKLMAYNFVLAMAGIVTMLSALTGSSAFLHFLYAALFGIFIGGYATMAAVATVELMGPDRAADAFGLVLGFIGVACLLGPPFGGLLFDLTQAYHLTYITAGFFQLVSALMLVPIALKRRRKSTEHA